RGPLESFLIEITAKIFRVKDSESGQPLVDKVLDKAGQKGTGKWTAQVALDLAVAIPTIAAAIDASKICSYAQGMALIQAGSREWNWSINMREMARIWKAGCIIRARFLDSIMRAYERKPDL